jgi:POT family proton-dependent oligopeptide transporter
MVPDSSEGTALTTNAVYSSLFTKLGAGSLAVGVALVVLIPFLRKLITDEAPAAGAAGGLDTAAGA